MSKYFVYALKSLKDNKLYIGFTSDIEKRVKTHNAGKVLSTKSRRPFKLVYSEEVSNREAAIVREKYLKSGCGREIIKAHIC